MRTYYSEEESTCKDCGHSCHHCDDAESCCQCEWGSINALGTFDCFFECPAGYFDSRDNKDITEDHYCGVCDDSCQECFWDGAEDCTRCDVDEVIWSDELLDFVQGGGDWTTLSDASILKGRCIDALSCANGKGPLGGFCNWCPENCNECSEGRCTMCLPGYRETTDGSCELDCSAMFPGCETCSTTECHTCSPGFEESTSGPQKCLPECAIREWRDLGSNDRECSSCNSLCETCDQDTGNCITCRPEIPHVPGQGHYPSLQTCIIKLCKQDCAMCHWDSDQNEVCEVCMPGFFLDANNNQCRPTECPDYLLYKPVEGICLDCPAEEGLCDTCNEDGCTSCNPATPYLTEDHKCVDECPSGTRMTDDMKCVSCEANCSDCYSLDKNDDGFLEEVCLECSAGLFLLEGHGCVEECPYGSYADEALGWCVKCSCDCETCSNSKYECDECKGPAYLNNEGICVVPTEHAPYAKYNDDWMSFKLYYPYTAFDVGYRSNFVDYYDEPILTCKDRMLDLDWNHVEFEADLEAVVMKLKDLTTEEEFAKLEEIADTLSLLDLQKYQHTYETSMNKWKVFYSVADSLFGRTFSDDLVQSQEMNINGMLSVVDFEVPELCKMIFGDENEDRLEKIGISSDCYFLDDESRDFDEAPFPLTVVQIDLDLETAQYEPDMNITVSNRWYRFDGLQGLSDTSKFFNARLDEVTIPIRSADEPLWVEAELILNPQINQEFAEANCASGVHFDWLDSTGICGMNMVEIKIDSVMEEGDDYAVSMSPEIAEFNEWLHEQIEDNYDGFAKTFDMEGTMLAPFVNK